MTGSQQVIKKLLTQLFRKSNLFSAMPLVSHVVTNCKKGLYNGGEVSESFWRGQYSSMIALLTDKTGFGPEILHSESQNSSRDEINLESY